MTVPSAKKLLLANKNRMLRPQDVFATSLYTGNGSTQTITNGINLAGNGGLFWMKIRDQSSNHGFVDTVRGRSKIMMSDSTSAEVTSNVGNDLISFNANGVTVGPTSQIPFNSSSRTYVGWSFQRAKKFFDVVTYTGNGGGSQSVAHGLGIGPGMIITKVRDRAGDWLVYHRDTGRGNGLRLNTATAGEGGGDFYAVQPSATSFIVSGNLNIAGATYVSYLFAHDEAATGIIRCGSYLNNADTVTLGWRPQFVLRKRASIEEPWNVFDATRGFSRVLFPNNTFAEGAANVYQGEVVPSATGFTSSGGGGGPYAYMAIRAPV